MRLRQLVLVLTLTTLLFAQKRDFWAFRSPVKLDPPAGLAPHPIDAFIRSKLAAQGLSPAPRADHRTLIRRLAFDLTGLPPRDEDYALTYTQAVDHYLASPHYGERWARHWLDVVRFGETDGGEHNYERFHAWPYRDYVIRSFNEDKPYPQFVREQIAGDLLAPYDPQLVAATGFLVAGPWDQVQAEINKDAVMAMTQRQDELDDMVTTTAHTFLGLTVNCARCHDHKFDPIPSRDYYRFTAAFNGVGYGTRTVASPDSEAAWKQKRQPFLDEISRLRKQLGDIEDPIRARLLETKYQAFDRQRAAEPLRIPLNPVFNRNAFAPVDAAHYRLVISQHRGKLARLEHLELRPAGIRLSAWRADRAASDDAPVIVPLPGRGRVNELIFASDRSRAQSDGQINVYRLEASDDGAQWRTVASAIDHVRSVEVDYPVVSDDEITAQLNPSQIAARRDLKQQIAAQDTELARLGDLPKVYAARPRPLTKAFLLDRGSVSKPLEEVGPGTLSALKQLASDLPPDTDQARRLALADWITDPRHPLTNRVLVNRIWYFHFGNGIVNTPSDFGLMGDRPSHPELLDWLAVWFAENGGSLKKLHRLILLSDTYQQSSQMNPKAFELDSANRLYWRMPLKRMDAETLRDTLLAVSGNLQLEPRGGPSFVMQKKDNKGSYIYKALNNDGPEVWRRAVYRFIVRGGERIMMDSFDCPDPAVATPQRSVSNTAVQALTLLNNEFVLKQAGFLAARAEKSAPTLDARIGYLYQRLFGRAPTPRELSLARPFIEKNNLTLYTRALLNTNEFLYVP